MERIRIIHPSRTLHFTSLDTIRKILVFVVMTSIICVYFVICWWDRVIYNTLVHGILDNECVIVKTWYLTSENNISVFYRNVIICLCRIECSEWPFFECEFYCLKGNVSEFFFFFTLYRYYYCVTKTTYILPYIFIVLE